MFGNLFKKSDQSLPVVRATVSTDTKQFRNGTKVYVIDAFWGGCDSVTVIGRQRASRRYAKVAVSVRKLEDFQMDRTYSPTIHKLIRKQYSDGRTYGDDQAKELLAVLPKWKEPSNAL